MKGDFTRFTHHPGKHYSRVLKQQGRVDLDALEAALSDQTAALMLTNPNTLGLFERDISSIAEAVHDAAVSPSSLRPS